MSFQTDIKSAEDFKKEIGDVLGTLQSTLPSSRAKCQLRYRH